LFTVNHPNGLIDPLIVTTNNPRTNYFLVRAASFKNPWIKKFLESLNLMPIYRIRDGVKQLSKNQDIFDKCFEILRNQKSLIIFPEGSHNEKRTIRALSKGFTRIVFGAIDKYPDLKITIIPVGITYQNVGNFPSKVALHYGKPIIANTFYNKEELNTSVNKLKEEISNQLKTLSVYIKDDENYDKTLAKLTDANVDFTNVVNVNNSIQNKAILSNRKIVKSFIEPILRFLIIVNSFIPYLLWKKASKKVDEIEFVDTFRFALNIVSFPIFYALQSWMISVFFGNKIAGIYFLASLCIIALYAKLSPTQ